MSLDGYYTPFDEYPNYSSMAPCMLSCDHNIYYNGCDRARCWCNKPNLELRMASITRCASSVCTFANMNTQTDVDILSGVQVMYCADKGFSPAGMTMRATSEATPTGSSEGFSSGTAAATGVISSRTGLGPSSTSDGNLITSESSSPSSSQTSGVSNRPPESPSSVMSTAAKAGIAIGAIFCILLIAIIILLLRRRRQSNPQFYPQPPPQPQNPSLANTNFSGPTQMAPTPFSNHSPYSPPALQQPTPLHIPPHAAQQQKFPSYNAGDVSPIEEKANPLAGIPRKEVGSGGGAFKKEIESPTPPPATATPASPARPHVGGNGPLEVQGSVPQPRHEVGNDGEITNTVTTRGMELDGSNVQRPVVNQYPGTAGGVELPAQQPQPRYQQSPQGQWGYGRQNHVHEVDGGQYGWGQRYEVDGGNGQQRQELGGSGPIYSGQGVHELNGR